MSRPRQLRGKRKAATKDQAEARPPTTTSHGIEYLSSTFQENEGLILVMGVTESGKSHFINSLQPGSAPRGHGLESETKSCSLIRTRIGATTVAMLDTPSFNDDALSDADILSQISTFLTTHHPPSIRLAGIIYLHRISDPRFAHTFSRFLTLLLSICGRAALSHTALVSTMWSAEPARHAALARDSQLQNQQWRELIEAGSHVFQFDGSRAMAQTIVGQVLGMGGSVVLRVQEGGLGLGQGGGAFWIVRGRRGSGGGSTVSNRTAENGTPEKVGGGKVKVLTVLLL
ncbi:hypothetical protein EJ04DRAFT_576067 [Polyplosphaeria fusca]|uniref:G domain-containing protein n=1 Tax=Polyplosphaeria fusca TaxID=682080 RepID=A0A9P4V3Q5_9PLEO|nr:hypothetical protein EJ04DRAFT_576067 [Polyplosphaeria fusca]